MKTTRHSLTDPQVEAFPTYLSRLNSDPPAGNGKEGRPTTQHIPQPLFCLYVCSVNTKCLTIQLLSNNMKSHRTTC